MDDVMEQLDALGVGRDAELPEPALDPWSPESFDMVHFQSRKKREQERPLTASSIPMHVDEGYETYSGSGCPDQAPEAPAHGLPQLSNYVERMESRLRAMHQASSSMGKNVDNDDDDDDVPPPVPPKRSTMYERPKSSMDTHEDFETKLRNKKSAYEMGRHVLNRTFTTKTNSTNASSTTQSTERSLMSGVSAGAISATSAGSLARKNRMRAQSALGMRELDDRPETPFTGISYHSSHASDHPQQRPKSQIAFHDDPMASVGGLVQPKPKKQNFIKRILESAKTGVASTRGSIATASAAQQQPSKQATPGLGPPLFGKSRDAQGGSVGGGLGGSGVDWVQVRRDVNRSNSLSQNELIERRERCQMLDYPALDPVEELYSSIEGDEGADGLPVMEPVNYHAINLSQVDKNSRFLANLPSSTTPITLATQYVCRPFRSDVQRLRAIFTWVAEKITWEEDFDGPIDTRRVVQTKRACAEEYATLVLEMCAAVGLTCEIVRGYLKAPGEIPELNIVPRSNHWWNAVIVDNEWRIMDCCLASPSNPHRAQYSSHSSSSADPFWFLTRPIEACWTHIPEHHAQQHICPPVAHEILLNLPCACPPFFKNALAMIDYNTSLTRIEDLEMVHVKVAVPPDVELAAEVEARSYARDADGDFFESGDIVKKRALAQAQWVNGAKQYTIKALLPGDEGTGVLKVYAGKRGLMHSIKDIPHPLAFALPIIHTGENPPYEFVTRHPTPHAQRHDIYVVQPQCRRLVLNNTFVFAVRQHPSTPATPAAAAVAANNNPAAARGTSPVPFARPSSALSMTSSAAGSNPSTTTNNTTASGGGAGGGSGSPEKPRKPAKLAIQTPGGKILRLMKKEERRGIGGGVLGRSSSSSGAVMSGEEEPGDGGVWETIIKCSERGVWRGLVLADRTARWCVFAEWVCE
jgi:transglutaminase/protease-like cytokinesis protein 3